MHEAITESNWSLHWRLTESAGLAIYLASYRGRRVIWEASLPYVTIEHQPPDTAVELASADDEEDPPRTHGTFWLPLGARTLSADVRHTRFRNGFEIAADFAAGPYAYTQLWRFHADGRVGAWLKIHRGGLHDAHTYHPHWRLVLDVETSGGDVFETKNEEGWERARREGWYPVGSSGALAFRQMAQDSGRAVLLEPHRLDDADVYALRYREGDAPPLTPHGGVGEEPFPASYPGQEPIEGDDLALWYVAHIHYRSSFPYTAGPLLRAEGY